MLGPLREQPTSSCMYKLLELVQHVYRKRALGNGRSAPMGRYLSKHLQEGLGCIVGKVMKGRILFVPLR